MYKRILMPIDGSECSRQAVEHGLELARRTEARVTFLYVVEDPLYYARHAVAEYGELYEELRRGGQEVLDAARRQAEAYGVVSETVLVEKPLAHPVDAILEAEEQHDLTVLGTHGRRGFSRIMLGSVAEGVLRRSSRPQLVIHCRGD
ncbi:MAG TPA: universal stress protein [Trueperaceae bacterium]